MRLGSAFISTACALLVFFIAAAEYAAADELEYTVKFLGMPAVRAHATIDTIGASDGSGVVRFRMTARSTAVYSMFYRVDNTYESYVDLETGYPIRYLRQIEEQGRRGVYTTNFYQDSLMALHNSVDWEPLSEKTFDFFSAVLYLQRIDWEVGDSLNIMINADKAGWKVTLVAEEERTDKIGGKKIETIRLRVNFKAPYPGYRRRTYTDILTNNLVNEKTRLYLDVTETDPEIPVKMVYKLGPLSVSATLNRLPGDD